jgi:hypothetical protein
LSRGYPDEFGPFPYGEYHPSIDAQTNQLSIMAGISLGTPKAIPANKA